ncbi:MAG: peptidyl-arginine deiminase, partial [Candidatus Cloacimonetes bacterium]|nr:peptidyl-arginine deiminase [Candidatus Cloacimonadota bacterium]
MTYRLRYFLLTLLLLMAVIAVYARVNEDFTITYAWERFTQTDPPTAPVRPIAEFEPASQVLIRYPLGIPLSLVAQLSNTAD